MIRFFKELILVSLLIAISRQACCKECIAQMKENSWYNVKTFDEPKKSNYTGFCKVAFNKEGTCCDQKDAAQYAVNWLKSVKQRVNATKAAMYKFRNSLEYVDKIQAYIKKNKKAILKAKKIIKKKELEDFGKELENYSKGVHNFAEREVALNDNLERCYSTLITYRANSICMRCSGKASEFYDKKKKKLKILKDVCKPLIKQCARVFTYFAEVTTFYHRMAQLRKAAKGVVTETAKAKGLLSTDLNALRICADDPDACLKNEALMYRNCKLVGLAELSPDVEGEVWTIEDGYKAVTQLALGKKINKLRRFIRLLGKSSSKKSSSKSSGSGKKKKVKGIKYGFITPIGSGADIIHDFNSSCTVFGDFDERRAIQLPQDASFAGKTSILSIMILVFILSLIN